MDNILLTRDTKGKCRIITMSLIENSDGSYTIKRSSGLFDGKKIEQPELTITQGKVRRTVQQQAELEYNSILKKLKDKGYKDTKDLGIVELTETEINEKLPSEVTNQDGVVKPMLCKVIDKEHPEKYNKTWLISNKLDGTRVLLYWKDGEIKSSSRGGGNYDVPLTYVRHDPYLVSLFKENPKLMLDGEAYRHGWTLNVISGLMRRDDLTEEHTQIKFYCYDIVDEALPFRERYDILRKYRDNSLPNSRVVFLKQTEVHNYNEIIAYHDKAVADGYEGAVIKDPDKPYKCGARDLRCQKCKMFVDNEFKIKGLAEGLRDEDMCFVMETAEGYEFKAKPIGDRAQKQWYRDHINELIGQMGTVKYFGMTNTDTPVPNLPSFRCVRYNGE